MKQLIELIHEYQNLSRKRKRSTQPLSEEEQARLEELRLYLDKHLRNDENAQRHRQSRPRIQPIQLEETYRDLDALALQASHAEAPPQTYPAPSAPTLSNAPPSAPAHTSKRPEDAPYIPSGPSYPAASLEVLDLQRLREQIEHPKRTHTEQPQPANLHPPSHTSIRTLRGLSEQAPSSLDQLPDVSALQHTHTQSPSQATRTQSPSQATRTQSPSQATRTQSPSQATRTQSPSQATRTQSPPHVAARSSSGAHPDRWHFLPRPATHADAEALPLHPQASSPGIVELDLTHLGLELNLPEEETPYAAHSPFASSAPPPLSLPLLIELRRLEHKRRRAPLAAHEETRFRELLDQVFLSIE